MIVVEPEGGLGNRLRVIHSAVQLSKATGHSLLVRWVEKRGMMCLYRDLFMEPDLFTVKDIRRKIFNRVTSYLLSGNLSDIVRKMRYDVILYNREIQENLHKKTDFRELVENRSKIFIKANQFFFEGDEGFFSPAPSKYISSRVERIVKNFDGNTVGIHIRGTDNRKSREMSPVSLFIDKMDYLLTHFPETRFYLSTDSAETRKMILNRFGTDKILFQNDIELSRDSRSGIEDAYIDMLCLSETKKIYGSYWSSFAAVAGSIGGIEKETLVIGN